MDRSGNVVSTKNVFDAPRGSAPNMFDPDDVIIRGIDTKDAKDAALVDITSRHGEEMIIKLARTILKDGQIHDVILMKDGKKPIVSEGRRRVLAFRLIKKWVLAGDERAQGLKEPLKVSCKTKRGDERAHMSLMIAGNEHAVADTPLSKARKALRLLKLGSTIEDLSIDFGVSEQAVEGWIKIAETHTDVQAAVDKGILSADGALALAALSREEQQAQLNELLEQAAALVPTEDPNAPTKAPKITGRVVRAKVNGAENPAPNKRQLNKILVAVKQEELDISEIEPEKILKWVVGKVPTSQMKGFTKVLEG